jgi:solute carrier family 35 (UDP-sugar transporter), member A1/2/3
MPTPDGHRYLPSTAVFLVDALKLVVCLTIAFYEFCLNAHSSATLASLLANFGNALIGGDSWKMAVPASLYTLANSLQYVGISNLDAATFHVVYQIKIIVTAIFSVMMLRKTLTPRQWLSLLLLMVGVALVSMPHEERSSLASSHHTRIYIPRSANPLLQHLGLTQSGSHLRKRSATYEGIEEDELALNTPGADASVGLLAVLAVCVCSGWAGVYFERTIKDSTHATSLWIRNCQLSLYSLFPAFFVGIVFLDGEHVAKNGFFAGYNWVVVISIAVQSFGGIVAAFCMYYADNISKNFAVSISMILSSFLSFVFFEFHASLKVSPGVFMGPEQSRTLMIMQFVIGTSIVLLATWMYSSHDLPNGGKPPRIEIQEYEKVPVTSPSEARDMSIRIPKTPLSSEESAIATSRPGSPSHKKRKNDIGYFTKAHD